MSIGALLSQLFNLGGHTDGLNSLAAARDFWGACAIMVVGAIAFGVVRANRPRSPRPH
jgi:hypothetical protein